MVEALQAMVLRQGARGLGTLASARYVVTALGSAFRALLCGSAPEDVGGLMSWWSSLS